MNAVPPDPESVSIPLDDTPELRLLEVLSGLNYRAGDLPAYLHAITVELSRLLCLDWSTVTLCQNGTEKVMASSMEFEGMDQLYSLHGSLTATVVETGRSLVVADTCQTPEFGSGPDGYLSYLGVPLRTSDGKVIGTICSFNEQPRSFQEVEVRIAEVFSQRAATAIDNYLMYQKQQEFNASLEQEIQARTAELHQTQADILEQQRLVAIGEFATRLMQEIRIPFRQVQAGLMAFQALELPVTSQERLELAVSEGNRLDHLLDEIAGYAQPSELQRVIVMLNPWMERLLETLRAMPEAIERVILWEPLTSEVGLSIDTEKMTQVMINLVRNACEAIAPGDAVKWIATQPSPHFIEWQIHNQGDPIPAEILPKLTQPFCSTKVGGTGLGLAVVKRIVEAHAGKLTITSSEIEGTTVTVRLPVIKINV